MPAAPASASPTARSRSAPGISRSTIESLAARPGYNPTLDVIDRLCEALRCAPGDLLERTPGQEPPCQDAQP